MKSAFVAVTLLYLLNVSCTKEVQRTVFLTQTDSVATITVKPFYPPYNGDSVQIPTQADSGLFIATVQVINMANTDSAGNMTQMFIGSPDSVSGMITVPNYPISVVKVSVTYQNIMNSYVDLVGFQYEYILTDNRIHITPNGWLASFQYVVMNQVFLIHARNQ